MTPAGISILPLTRRGRALGLSSVFFAFSILATGCDGFYSDSPPLGVGPTVTQSSESPADPRLAVEQAARAALSEQIGVPPEAPRLIQMTGVTWTAASHGCFPFDTSAGGAALVPGVSAQFEYEHIVYQYDADQAGITGELCDSTFRDVPAASALRLFNEDPFLPAQPVILLTAEEATAFIGANSGAAFNVELVDWPAESLGAIAVDVTDTTLEPLVRGARLSEDGTTVILELTVFESASPTPGKFPMWVFLEDSGNATTLQTEVVVSEAPDPTPTPPPFAQQ